VPDLPEVRERYVADVRGYSGPLREAAQDADRFSRQNDQAALAARRMGLAAKEAADKAARAQKDAADAAERLAKGEIKADEAARAAARAENELERASIKAAEAQRATANAADKAAAQYRQVARDAALAAAAENLGALKAAGSVKQHNAELARMRSVFPEIEKDASGAFKAMENEGNKAYQALTAASQGLADTAPLWPAAIANALTLLPAAASVAGGGITLAMGGALAGLGIMAQAKAADVKRAFSNMKTSVVGELKQISAPFHDTLLHIAADGKLAFASMAPALQGAFAQMGPAVTRFAASFTGALGRLNPMIASLGTAFSHVLDSLGPQMGTILNNVGTGFKAIFDAVSSNPAALANFVTGISQVIRYLGDGIGVLIRFSSEFRILSNALGAAGPLGLLDFANGVTTLGHALTGTTGGLQVVTQTFPSFQQQAIMSAAATQHLMTAQQAAALTADQLKTAMDSLTGKTLTERESLVGYRQAIDAMTKSLKDNGAAHGFNSTKGAANEQALDKVALSAQKVAQAMKAAGQAPGPYLDEVHGKLVAMAEKMHYSASQANDLANKLLGIKPVTLSMNDANFMSKLHKAQGLRIDPKTGLLKGNNSDYFDKWLKAKGLKIDPKTGLFKGNNSDYYNSWLRANGLKINTKTGKITGNTAAFWSSVHSIPPVVGTRTIRVDYTRGSMYGGGSNLGGATGGQYEAGKRFHYAGGGEISGLVTGPGTGTSDSIMAPWLSNGEFVVNSKQTQKHLGLLMAINKGVAGFASGGKVGSIGSGWSNGTRPPTKAELAAQHRVSLAHARPEYLAAMAAQQQLEAMRRTVYGGWFNGASPSPGSAHGTVVQHVTQVTVNVQGSVTTANNLARELQGILISNRMPTSLPAGR
jgi:hypothetical protein